MCGSHGSHASDGRCGTCVSCRALSVVIIHKGEPPSFEDEWARDVIEIITVFSARLYGSRSHQSRKIIYSLKEWQEQA